METQTLPCQDFTHNQETEHCCVSKVTASGEDDDV